MEKTALRQRGIRQTPDTATAALDLQKSRSTKSAGGGSSAVSCSGGRAGTTSSSSSSTEGTASVWLLGLLSVLLYSVMLWHILVAEPKLQTTLDTTPLWSKEDARNILTGYGQEGRYWFLSLNSIDRIFALCYPLLLHGLLHRTSWNGNWVVCTALPMGCALFDFLENCCTRLITEAFPAFDALSVPPVCMEYGGSFTLIKFVFIAASIACLVWGWWGGNANSRGGVA